MENFFIAVGVTVLGIFLYYSVDLVPRVKAENRYLRNELNTMRSAANAEIERWYTEYCKKNKELQELQERLSQAKIP